ncbi:SDR family oxidoreductase [Pantoea sp. EA-12]|uniref:SDR family NAD(P)-dependent oxidoreductase n=1 Tax=Pantoea sp. EA-12 TaxID=3043303 RepID=UPI0024B588D5|nr:SDR family oxidoreductase [Pantoea sp. EA-12]MDI9219698.1 SDR family oxidoreductase [Pantoea sp. EA-12]
MRCLKTAVITGGTQGVGLRMAQRLAQQGYAIALVGRRNQTAAQQAVAALKAQGAEAAYWLVDITQREEVIAMLASITQTLGKPQLLVNNAGSSAAAPLLSLSDSQWQQVVHTQLTGTFVMSVETARHMLPGGVIINIAGASAHRCYPNAGAFGPSKAAVVNLTAQMLIEWAPLGIRVCGISPGPIRDEESDWRAHEPLLAEEVTRLPLQRPVSSEEVARSVVFLASDAAAAFTGQMLILDSGGLSTWYMTQQETR